MINSVLPVLTKCKQVDPSEEDETDKVDPEAVKGTIFQQFENEMVNQFRDMGLVFQDMNEDSQPADQDQEDKLQEMH